MRDEKALPLYFLSRPGKGGGTMLQPLQAMGSQQRFVMLLSLPPMCFPTDGGVGVAETREKTREDSPPVV